MIAGPSACGSSGSLMLARVAEDRELLAASEDVADAGLTEGEAQELLGGRDRSLHEHPAASPGERARPRYVGDGLADT